AMHFCLLIRGKRGKDRISAFVLSEYISMLLILWAAALLFWAILLKASVSPHELPLSTATYFVAAHFLPGVSIHPLYVPVPGWLEIGASFTAFTLFVIFIGPASSLVPDRQAAYGRRLAATYKMVRRAAVDLARYVKRLETLKRPTP